MPPRQQFYTPTSTIRRREAMAFQQKADADIFALGAPMREAEIEALGTLPSFLAGSEDQQPRRQPMAAPESEDLPIVLTPQPSMPSMRQERRQPAPQDAPIELGTEAFTPAPVSLSAPAAGGGANPPAVTTTTASGAPAPTARGGAGSAYQIARANGLDDEGSRIIASVAETEGGGEGRLGDNGQSHGVLQFHERGELPGFAAWLGVPIEEARRQAQNPELAIRYATQGYLGAALAEGRRQGLSGADLATFVQRTGQRSEAPETTGANYERLYGAGAQQQPDVSVTPDVRVGAPAADVSVTGEARVGATMPMGTYTPETLTPNQFTEGREQGLSEAEALAVCGPAAAVAFARVNGRNPTLREAKELAQGLGLWDVNTGMHGPASQVQLLDRLGVKSNLQAGADWATIAREVQAGRPVIVDTPLHYYTVTGYDARTGEFEFGASAGVLTSSRGKTRWRPEELPGLGMGSPRATIYMGGAN